MEGKPVFLDTNVLIYLVRPDAEHHKAAFERVRSLDSAQRPIWISTQVLREYLAVATRPQGVVSAIPVTEALRDVRRFQGIFEVIQETPFVFGRLIELLAQIPAAGKQVHDAYVVASMLEHGIRYLLTFNQRDFRRFGQLIELEAI